MPENTSLAFFNQLIEQLAEERLNGLRLRRIGDSLGLYIWDYGIITSVSYYRGKGGYFDSALDALLDFVVWTQECNNDSIKQLCNIDSDI